MSRGKVYKMIIKHIDDQDASKSVEIDLTGLYYVLLHNELLKLDTMEIVKPIYDDVYFIDGDYQEVQTVFDSYSNFVHINNGRYEYLDLTDDICFGNQDAEYTFRAHFTNDFIWDLFLKYHKEHLNGRRYCDVANYCNVIYHTIEGISLYDAEGSL